MRAIQSRVQLQGTFLSYILWHLLGPIRPHITVANYILLTIRNVQCEGNGGKWKKKNEAASFPIRPSPTLAFGVVNNESLIPGSLTSEVTEGWLRSTRTGQEKWRLSREPQGELRLSRGDEKPPSEKLSVDADGSGNDPPSSVAHGPLRALLSPEIQKFRLFLDKEPNRIYSDACLHVRPFVLFKFVLITCVCI